MDSSIIDLCDSDDDGNRARDDSSTSSSSSSSSSGDSYLWKAGGFLKGSPSQRKSQEEVEKKKKKEEESTTKRGNYFKEVRSKCGVARNDDDDYNNAEEEKKMTTKTKIKKSFQSQSGSKSMLMNSPRVSLDVDDDDAMDDEMEGGSVDSDEKDIPTKFDSAADGVPKKHASTNEEDDDDSCHDSFPRREQSNNVGKNKKRQFSPQKSSPNLRKLSPSLLNPRKEKPNNFGTRKSKDQSSLDQKSRNNTKSYPSFSPTKKKCKKFVPIIKKVCVQPVSKPVECIEIDLSSDDGSSDDDKINKKVASENQPSRQSNSKFKNGDNDHDINNDHCFEEADDDSDYHAEFRIKRPPPARKVQNPYSANLRKTNSHDNSSADNGSSQYSSDDTVPLPPEKMSPAMLVSIREGGGRMMGSVKKKKNGSVTFTTSVDVEFTIENDDCDSGAEDFSFDNNLCGGFDDDDDGDYDDYGDQIGSKVNNDTSLCKNETGKDTIGNSLENTKTHKTTLKNDDVLDIESDDDDSSNSSELCTPRPFKKKASKPLTTPTTNNTVGNNKLENHKSSTANAKSNEETKICPNSSTSSKMLTPTPQLFSPTTLSPTLGTYSIKRKVPTPVIPAVPPSLLKEIGGKLYPDIRHNFLIALTSHARRLRNNSYQRAAFDGALRSVVVISLHMRPIRSVEASRRIKGVGGSFHELLKESIAGAKGKNPFAPANGKYSCVAAAALVALLELEEANGTTAATSTTNSAMNSATNSNKGNNNTTTSTGICFPMEHLIQKINQLLDSRANASLNQSAEKYLDVDNLDPGWGQIKKLASSNAAADLGGPFLKGRKKKDACVSGQVYELLDSGREIAKKLRDLAHSGPAEPGPLRQLPDETVDEEFGNVTMSMDFREGGGGGKSLHKMCDQLDIRGVPYVVRELKIADYIFFVGDKLAPILIERKTADDVASSLHDGRWERQQRSMRKAQWVLGGGSARRCQICYIIEGDANKKKVHGGNVGRRAYSQSVEDVEHAIEQLPELGFSVMRTKGHLDTVGLLAKVAQDVSWKANRGNIDTTVNYKDFLRKVKALGDEIGDPPTEREHQNPAPPVVTNAEYAPEASANPLDDDRAFSPCHDTQNDVHPKNSSAQTLQKDENSEEYSELKKMSIAELKEKCKERDEKIGGKKNELIARLLKPRKPEILIMRARRKEYVPKIPSSNAALMVALLLNHVPGSQGMAKERLMVLAEETGVSKESMGGDGGFYDGWSGMKQLQEGDPALVRREKGHRYSLTTQPPESCGRAPSHMHFIFLLTGRDCAIVGVIQGRHEMYINDDR